MLRYHLRLKRIRIKLEFQDKYARAREGGSSKIINEIEGKPEFGLTK